MEQLTRMEKISLLAFLKTSINRDITSENLKEEMTSIYLKLEKEFRKEWIG